MKKLKILARFAHSPRLSFTTNFPHKCQTKFFSDVGSIIETYAYSICVWQLAFLALQCFCGCCCCCRERLGVLRLLASFSWFRWGCHKFCVCPFWQVCHDFLKIMDSNRSRLLQLPVRREFIFTFETLKKGQSQNGVAIKKT